MVTSGGELRGRFGTELRPDISKNPPHSYTWALKIRTYSYFVPCKVKVVTYFARDPLRSYFHEPQKNEIYFLNKSHRIGVGHQWLPRGGGATKGSFWYGVAARHL